MIYVQTIEEMFEFPARTTVSVVDDDIVRQFRLSLFTINSTALKIVLSRFVQSSPKQEWTKAGNSYCVKIDVEEK